MPVIETARLRLRPFTLDDAEAYYQTIMRDPDVRRYLPGGQPLPREQAVPTLRYFMDYWSAHGMGGLAIIHIAENKLIGQCGLQIVPKSETDVEVYYALAKDYWGQGIATEAARACLRYGFETLKLDQIVALFMPENKASERVMIKLGMTYQGTRRAYNANLPYYAITREAFDPGDAPYRVAE